MINEPRPGEPIIYVTSDIPNRNSEYPSMYSSHFVGMTCGFQHREGMSDKLVIYPKLDDELLSQIDRGVRVKFWPAAWVSQITECEIANTWFGEEGELKILPSERHRGTHALKIKNSGSVLVAVMPATYSGLMVKFFSPHIHFDAGMPLKMTEVMSVWEARLGSSREIEFAKLGAYDYLSDVVRDLAVRCEANYPWRFRPISRGTQSERIHVPDHIEPEPDSALDHSLNVEPCDTRLFGRLWRRLPFVHSYT